MKAFRRAFDRWVLAGRPTVVRLHHGDVIVIEAPGQLSVAHAEQLRRDAEDIFGYHHDVLILDSGSTLTVVVDTDGVGR